ncbi:probable RNA-directed DNA polymerase from transposon X-element [Aspergillus terreus]|uniref:Probable RNA-directed DNA polymerase from transposon X-element n=1 Tax=Aspergillus terreus TaxID=33178 RepID=A0A5M3ZC31_ASPTE|nr:hypothetical protein ATETN484_0011034200 [Aspergillus terreus]GFF18984.1 probable RNA-directed DNA polymerase from transposon X-element [Aspergillus terreus]
MARNEAADEAAKKVAAQKKVKLKSVGLSARPIIRLAAAAKQAIHQPPQKRNIALYKSLSKPHTLIIIQMRTMYIGLQHFLYKIKASDSDRCSCGEGSQTPRHVLLQCPLYREARGIMIEQLQAIKGLRGKLSDYDSLVSNLQAIRYIAEFMHQTGLLQQFRHVDMGNAEQDQEQGSLLRGSGIDVEDDG